MCLPTLDCALVLPDVLRFVRDFALCDPCRNQCVGLSAVSLNFDKLFKHFIELIYNFCARFKVISTFFGDILHQIIHVIMLTLNVGLTCRIVIGLVILQVAGVSLEHHRTGLDMLGNLHLNIEQQIVVKNLELIVEGASNHRILDYV